MQNLDKIIEDYLNKNIALELTDNDIPDPMNWSIYAEYLEKQEEEKELKDKKEQEEKPKKVETWRDRPAML